MSETPDHRSNAADAAVNETVSKDNAAATAANSKQPDTIQPASRSRRLMTVLLVLVVLIIAGGIGLVLSRDLWGPTTASYLQQMGLSTQNSLRSNAVPKPAPEGTKTPNPVTVLAKRLDGLATEIASVQARLATTLDPDLANRLQQVEKTLPALGEDVQRLSSQISSALSTLTARINQIEQIPAQNSADPAASAANAAVVGHLRNVMSDAISRLDRLEATPKSNLAAQVSALAEENKSLRLQIQQQAGTTASLSAQVQAQLSALSHVDDANDRHLLAVNLLAQVTAKNLSFEAELAAISDAALEPQDRAFLTANARVGVTTMASLKKQFNNLLPTLVRTAQVGEDAGFIGRILNRLAEVVEVRRIDGQGDDADAKIARAEVALAAGDLATAITALDGLPDAAATAAEPWLISARKRLNLDTIVSNLQARALKALQPSEKSGG